jgi:S1-C subfamily serine protease
MNPAPSSRSSPGTHGRSGRSRWRGLAAALLGAAALSTGAHAAETASDAATQVRATLAQLEPHRAALARANAAVVGLEVVAVEDARSISTLGKERQGSGTLISDDGLVLTIGYLILEAERVDLVLGEGKRVPARVVAYDLASGFGLVQALAPLAVAPAPLGESAQVAADQPLLFASGGDERDLSLARMVSRRPFSGYWEYHIEGALFTAPARTDHSGAGLFNAAGELVGVGSLIVGNVGGGSGPAMRGNMFVPVDLLKPILAEMQQTGSSQQSRRPWLGLTSTDQGGRVSVVRVNKDSPAADSGLQAGDVVLAVDGMKVTTLEAFYKAVWARPSPEAEIMLSVLQGSEIKSVVVKSVDRMTTMTKPSGI